MTGALDGMAAIVTGGNGAIGSASARLLARDGAAVLLMARTRESLEAKRRAILETAPGAKVEIFVGDGMKEADVAAALETAHAMRGRLDMIVATVGGGNGFRPLMMLDAETFRAQFDRNVVSAFIAIRYGVPLMRPGGSIVCISSTAATLPFGHLAAYHTAKGGLENLVRAAAEELGSAGIRVNAVRPGLTETDRVGHLFQDQGVLGKFIAEFPLGRPGRPVDIGEAVRFLAGPESSWVTGQSFAVDGGQELRKNPDLTDMVAAALGADAVAAARKGKPL